jgi:hypothetical protein
MSVSGRSAGSFLLPFAVTAAGCAFRVASPSLPHALAGDAAPPAHLEITAIDVEGEAAAEPGVVEQVRADVRKMLAGAARASCTGDGPVLVHISVRLGEYVNTMDEALRQDGFAGLGYVAYPFGATYEVQKLAVDVAVTRAGHTFEGHGEAEKEGSIYAHARERALGVALDRALADAAASRRPQ